jgi:glycosyltransferase involved in cell wall biosynthesis
VLSTALPGVHAYLPGDEALLIPGNRPDEFVWAIQSLHDDPDRRRAMGEAARRRAETLSWARIAPQYEALYADLAS